MTLKVRKDHVAGMGFEERVAAHVAAMNEYRKHLRGVAEDAENPNLKPDERRVAFPGPDAPNLIKSAVTLDGATDQYVPDYEFVGPPLAERKDALMRRVREIEAAAIEANIPAAKRRHWFFAEIDIRDADAKRFAETDGDVDYLTFTNATRAPVDTAFIAAHNERQAKEAAIQRWAAKLEHDIADLTDETIDAFNLEPFNG